MFKVIRKMAPPILIEQLPDTVALRNQHRTRNAKNIDIPRARTEAYAESFFPSSTRAWNNLDEETKNIANLEDFKERTKPKPPQPPK